MKKSGKIFMWLLIAVIIILIIYVIFLGKKPPEVNRNLFDPASGGNGSNGNNPIVIPPTVTVSEQAFSINDQIYAGGDLTNTYTSCSPTSANIYNTYKKGDLIGTFLRKENLCIVIAVKTYPLGFSWIPIEGSEDVYLPLNALVYKG